MTLILSAAAERRINHGEPWLTVWMEAAGVTEGYLAERTGIDPERMALFAADDDAPLYEEMDRIAEALGTTRAEIDAVQG